jgi:hypothetical protein
MGKIKGEKTHVSIPRMEIRKTRKYGKGVFAGEEIKKGQCIHIMNGEVVSQGEALKRVLGGDENIDDIFQTGKTKYLDLDDLSRTFNHSCAPNVGIGKKNKMFALRKIKKGEEITYDYSATVAPTEWAMKCRCGSKKCRKVIGYVTTITKKDLVRYGAQGALQDYMVTILKSLKKNKEGKVILPKYELAALKILNKNIK